MSYNSKPAGSPPAPAPLSVARPTSPAALEPLESRQLLSAVPNSPFALSAGATAPTAVSLQFYDNSDDETAFVVERSASAGGPFGAVASLGAFAGRGARAWSDPAAPAGATSYYRVKALIGAGSSNYAGPVAVTTPTGTGGGAGGGNTGGAPAGTGTVPNSPFALSASAASPTSVVVQFYDNSDDETAFVVERSTAGGAFAPVATPPAGSGKGFRAWTDTAASAGTAYAYRVKAVNGAVGSNYAGPAAVTTPGTAVGGTGGTTAGTGTTPNSPFALSVSAHSSASVTLTFYDNSDDETGFVIERAVGAGGFAPLATAPASAGKGFKTYVDAATAPGVAYAYRVSAVNGARASGYAGPASVVTPGTPTPTPMPTPTPSETPRNLLFFGNSFTFYNDSLPLLVRDVAADDGHAAPNVFAQTSAGWTLGDHVSKVYADAAAGIIYQSFPAGAAWDDVVLQDLSTRPTGVTAAPIYGDPAGFRRDASTLLALVRGKSPAAHGILLEPWARGADNPFYPGSFTGPAAMQADLLSNYTRAAGEINAATSAGSAEVAPAGEAWKRLNWARDLYDGPDEYHPSQRGSLLAALVVYNTIYHEHTSDIPAARAAALLSAHGLTAADWTQLTAAADATVG